MEAVTPQDITDLQATMDQVSMKAIDALLGSTETYDNQLRYYLMYHERVRDLIFFLLEENDEF
jgi:hypothetical protein